MNTISTHVLDTSRGGPAEGVAVTLESVSADGATRHVGGGVTDGDGRVRSLLPATATLPAGTYRLTFETGAYFRGRPGESFYPEVKVTFVVRGPSQHYHVPLLVSPFGYTTYRGS